MGVKVRILGAAGAVAEGGGDESLAVLADLTATSTAYHAGLGLQVGERRLPGGLVGIGDRTAHSLVVAEGVQQADALGQEKTRS